MGLKNSSAFICLVDEWLMVGNLGLLPPIRLYCCPLAGSNLSQVPGRNIQTRYAKA